MSKPFSYFQGCKFAVWNDEAGECWQAWIEQQGGCVLERRPFDRRWNDQRPMVSSGILPAMLAGEIDAVVWLSAVGAVAGWNRWLRDWGTDRTLAAWNDLTWRGGTASAAQAWTERWGTSSSALFNWDVQWNSDDVRVGLQHVDAWGKVEYQRIAVERTWNFPEICGGLEARGATVLPWEPLPCYWLPSQPNSLAEGRAEPRIWLVPDLADLERLLISASGFIAGRSSTNTVSDNRSLKTQAPQSANSPVPGDNVFSGPQDWELVVGDVTIAESAAAYGLTVIDILPLKQEVLADPVRANQLAARLARKLW